MAIVNPLLTTTVKDSRWLQLEVCREFQRNKCSRSDTECKFAHPGPNVEIQNGRVIACYDSIKGRCNREKPPCKYFHPPKHLKEQLIINGKNHLALKNALLHQVPFPVLTTGPMVGPISNLLNAYPRNVVQPPPSLVNSNCSFPMAAFATALNGSSSLLMPNSPVNKAQNPYLSAIAAASSAAYGAFHTTPASTPASTAAAAMLAMSPEHQFGNGSGGGGGSSTGANYGQLAAAVAAAAAAANHSTTTPATASITTTAQPNPSTVMNNSINHNSTNVANTNKIRTTVPDSNGNNATVAAAAAAAAAAASLESQVLTEASTINAVANAAAVAAAAGRKRARDSNDKLLMQLSYPISKRPALDKNGTALFHPAAAAAAAAAAAVSSPAAAAAAAAASYAHAQPFAAAVHQPLVPFSFYFPLNTIPRY